MFRATDGINYTEEEQDGTLAFHGNATVWRDVMFPMAPPKVTGTGNPSLATFSGNLRGYSFAVNDTHDFDPQEITHDVKVGSTGTWHIHWLSRSSDGTDRAVKWQLEYALEGVSGVLAAPTTVTVEITIAANTAANTVHRSDVATVAIPAIARLAYAKLTRIAASLAAPSVDPLVGGMHIHIECDTFGSRGIMMK